MNGYADFKANSLQLIDSVTVYDGTNRSTLTTTTLSGTNLVISNANLSGTTTGVTVNASDNSSKLATTAFVKDQSYVTATALTAETMRAIAAEALKENASNKSTNMSTDALSDTMYPSVKSVKSYVDMTVSAYTTALTAETTRSTAAEALKENVSNKSINVSTDATSDTKYPSVKAVKTYVDAETTRATAAEALKENVSNKSINVSTDALSDTKYPSVIAVKTYVDAETTRATAAENLRSTTTYVNSTFGALSSANVWTNTNYLNARQYVGNSTSYTTNAVLNVRITGSYGRDGISVFPSVSNLDNLMVFYNTANADRGSITGVGQTSISYQTSSDRRLKTNIQPMPPMIDKMMALKPSQYNWKVNNEKGYGFIAQDLHRVFPELRCVKENSCSNLEEPTNIETGEPIYYGIDYGSITPYIVKAIQEIKVDYEAKLAKLEERLAYLENK